MALYKTGNPVPSSAMPDVWDNNRVQDEILNSEELEVETRTGIMKPTWKGVLKKNEDEIEKTRQNLIPLSKQYATLAAAQADIVNIPEGSTTYYRSPDDSALAVEVINNAGTLQPTGRKMPSQQAVEDVEEQTQDMQVAVQALLVGLQKSQSAIAEIVMESVSPDVIEQLKLDSLRSVHLIEKALIEGSIKIKDEDKLRDLRTLQLLLTAMANGGNDSARQTAERGTDMYSLPVPTSVLRIDLTIPKIPSSKADPDVEGEVTITVDGAIFNAKCAVWVQGASSASYPKKNLNIEFFNANRTDNIKLKLGDVMPFDTLTFKANWIDAMHVRNTMNYRIWDQIVQSRKGFPKYETDWAILSGEGIDTYFTGAKGFPMGYECVLYVNGNFYGIGDLMSGKKKESYNIPKNGPTQVLLDNGNWHNLTKLYANAIEAQNAEIKAPKKVTDDTIAILKSWDDFCVEFMAGNVSEGEFYARMDKANIIDFVIFTQFMAAQDTINNNNIKNTQTCTYDGKKWFFMPYDLDTCYGLHWAGGSVTATNPATFNIFYGTFWTKVIAMIGKPAFLARWEELKALNILTVDAIGNHARSIQAKFGNKLYEQEQSRYPSVPSIKIATTTQLLSWVSSRMAFMDSFFK
ncbi:CotH kinase family protein [Klebsiella pneumoniae]|uniref:CotH kinase family protein n=1 Tax=Klebsiella pneumoniae TaxID=573 RepID=UPI0024A9BB06|nr:CotH kinase family protein [Klebsiella pneumoniae]HDO7151616.1 CotH kinase family protein [Klebsiella pneumoniae]